MSAYLKALITFFLLVFIAHQTFAGEYDHNTDSLLKELNNPHHDTVRIKLLSKLSSITFFSNDSSLAFVKQAVSIAEKTKLNEWITKAQVALGMWYLNHSNTDTSIAIWHQLYMRMKKENYQRGMATAYRYIGKAFLFNSVDSAIHYNLKSIELFKQLKDSAMVNSIKINLAVVYAQSGRFNEGIALTKEGLAFAERTGNINDALPASINIGIFYREIGNLDSAIVYIKKRMLNCIRREVMKKRLPMQIIALLMAYAL